MSFFIFVIIVIASFIIVRVAAVAFELTGLAWSLAKFQAISCFTGTGFTTKESELVTRDPKRRKIATIIMILGHAGLITLIATFVNSLRVPDEAKGFDIFSPAIKVLILIIAFIIVYFIFTKTGISEKLHIYIRKHLIKYTGIESLTCKQLLIATAGHEVSKVIINEAYSIVNKSIKEAKLKQHDITVLAIERGKEIITNPTEEVKILKNDTIICFGKIGDIKKEICS